MTRGDLVGAAFVRYYEAFENQPSRGEIWQLNQNLLLILSNIHQCPRKYHSNG
jgi:hypothetical protein